MMAHVASVCPAEQFIRTQMLAEVAGQLTNSFNIFPAHDLPLPKGTEDFFSIAI
jgi:hypothetical protein